MVNAPAAQAALASLHPPYARRLQRRDPLTPQRRFAGELVPLLLPGSSSVQREDQRAHLRTHSQR